MSKFCQNCGSTMDDAARFCNACGTPVAQAPQQPQQPQYQAPQQPQQPQYQAPQYQTAQPQYQAPQQPQYQQPQYQQPQYQQPQYQAPQYQQPQYQAPQYQQPQYQAPQYQQPQYQAPVAAPAQPKAPKNAGKFDLGKIFDQVKMFANGLVNRCKADKPFMYKCVGIGAAALVVLIVLGVLIFGGGSYTAPIDNWIAVSFKGNANKIGAMAPKEYWDYLEEEEDVTLKDMKEDYKDKWDDLKDAIEDTYGKNIRVTYKVLDKDELSKKELKGIAKALDKTYDIDRDSVKKGYELEVEMTIKGSEDDDEQEQTITVIQIGSKWYWINWSESGDNYYARFMIG